MSEYYTITPGFFENLPKKSSSSGVIFYNDAGEILLVKPNYKPGWGLPGGMLDTLESPTAGAIREVQEEIGLFKPNMEILCIDYIHQSNPERDAIQFIFSGGILSSDEINQIVLQESELDDFQFMKPEIAISNLGTNVAKRIQAILSHKGAYPIYLEHGMPPGAK